MYLYIPDNIDLKYINKINVFCFITINFQKKMWLNHEKSENTIRKYRGLKPPEMVKLNGGAHN